MEVLRRLGKTQIEVSPIGLGGNQFSWGDSVLSTVFRAPSQDQVNQIIQAALKGGINFFDTAEVYGFGRSEEALSTALLYAGCQDEDVVIATKWFPLFRKAAHISRSIANRIRYLQNFTIDLYMVHLPWSFSTPETEMDAMANLIDSGLIRSVGVSNFNVQQMQRAHVALAKRGHSLAVNQVQYSLVHRNIETNGILRAAQDLGVTIVAWGPLASGLLTGLYHKEPARLNRKPFYRKVLMKRQMEQTKSLIQSLEEIGSRYDATVGQIALNWLIHSQGESVIAIPGASSVDQAAENAGALTFRLSEEEMAQIDEISRPFRA